MDEKEKLLSDAREVIIEDEKLKVLLKEGRISEETYDYKHGEINMRLAEIKEQIANINRKKNQLSAPASVEKFNNSFVRRQFARKKENAQGDDEALSNAGMAAVVFGAALIIGLLVFPDAVYSTLPNLPEPYVLPESSRLFCFLAVLAAQTLIGGLFLWLSGKAIKLKGIDYNKAVTCACFGAVITSGILSIIGFLSSDGKYTELLQFLGYAAGIFSYYWALKSALRANRRTMAILSVALYAINYALALAAAISIIILL
jgi:hypothetical protein